MIIQPVISEALLLLFFAGGIAFTVFVAIRSRKNRSLMWSWARRAVIVLLFTLLALRPGIGEMQQVDVYTNQYDVYFVVDTTSSMIAEDWGDDADTRLSAVKQDIGQIVDTYAGARYSLLTFDSSAIIRTPLTRDASAVMSSVNILSPEITKYSKGSSVGIANQLLEETLKRNMEAEPERARIVFFFSDGEQTAASDPESFSSSTQYINGGEVYGYGTEEGGKMASQNGYVITTTGDEYIMDNSKNPAVVALSKIDEKNLQTIAQELGLEYEKRDADTPIKVPDLKDEKISVSSTSGMKITSDFTWVIAIPLYALMAFELAYVLLYVSRLSRKHKEEANPL